MLLVNSNAAKKTVQPQEPAFQGKAPKNFIKDLTLNDFFERKITAQAVKKLNYELAGKQIPLNVRLQMIKENFLLRLFQGLSKISH